MVAGVQGPGRGGQDRWQRGKREESRAGLTGNCGKEERPAGEAKGDEAGENRQCREGAVIPAGGRGWAGSWTGKREDHSGRVGAEERLRRGKQVRSERD